MNRNLLVLLTDLKQKLEKAELKNQRLTEVFQSTSQEFRTAVYQLLGYRVDLKGNHQYQLRSMYAETPNDVFYFKVSLRLFYTCMQFLAFKMIPFESLPDGF